MAFDATEFKAGLKAASAAVKAAALRAADVFGDVQILGDAQEMAPVATGFLKSSGTTEPAVMAADGGISKRIGFNAIYAVYVHEDLEAHHDDGQAKFLEESMRRGLPKFGPFVAGQIKDVL